MTYRSFTSATRQLLGCLLLIAAEGVCGAANPAQGNSTQHPRLLFTEADLPALRQRFDEPANSEVKKRTLERAAALLTYSGNGKYESTPENFDKMSYKIWADKGMGFVTTFSWAYVLTGDKLYTDALWSVLKHECKVRGQLKQNDFRFEFVAKSNGVNAALAYDVAWAALDDEKRATLATYLDQYLIFKDKPSFGWKNNIGLGYFSAVGLIALARLDENPKAREVLAECIKRLKEISYPASIVPHPDGAYPEGALYADYMFLYLLPFIQRYEEITGDKNHGLWEPAFFRNTHRMVETLTGGDGLWAPIYDSQPQPYGAAWLAGLGQRTNNDVLRWAAEHYYRETIAETDPAKEVGRSLIAYVLNRAWKKEVQFPGLPTLALLPSINTGTLRSDKAIKPGLMITVRGYGEKEVSMRGQHLDVGSFLLYARGENFLIDPGYNQPEPVNHSMPQINGLDVQVRANAPLMGDEKGNLRMLTIDPTLAYKKPNTPVTAFRRTWVMAGDEAVILLDDVRETAAVVSRFQAGFAAEIQPDHRSAIIHGKSNRLWMGAFGPESQMTMSGPLDFGKSWVYKQWADEGKVAWHRLEAAYQHDPEKPMIWVFVPMKGTAAAPDVSVRHDRDRVAIKVPGQSEVIFNKVEGVWQAAGFSPKPGAM